MNNRICLVFSMAMLLASAGFSQRFTKNFSSSGQKKVNLLVENGVFIIEGHAGNEVVIEASGYKGVPERAKGLRPLYNGASDNTGLGLQVDESNNAMSIRKASGQNLEYRIKVPTAVSLSIQENGWMGGEIKVSNINGEIEIKSNGAGIELTNVSGPVVANTTSGNIEVVFSQLSSEPSSLSNVGGFIDITLPASAKANLDLNSISGEIYTDFDIKMEGQKEGMNRVGGRRVKGTVNGGGAEVAIRAISGDIYLRKK